MIGSASLITDSMNILGEEGGRFKRCRGVYCDGGRHEKDGSRAALPANSKTDILAFMAQNIKTFENLRRNQTLCRSDMPNILTRSM
jgi:hypothetical protein